MERKLFGIFNGAQLTIMFGIAVLAPSALYAIPSFTNVAIEDPSSGARALVDSGRHLTVALSAPNNVVTAATSASNGCKTVYTPPAGKAIVVTQVTYSLGSGVQGTENYGGLYGPNCSAIYDLVDTVQAFETESRTFPSGLPLAGVSASSAGSGTIFVTVHGYLIPATSLPAAAPQVAGQIKGMPSR